MNEMRTTPASAQSGGARPAPVGWPLRSGTFVDEGRALPVHPVSRETVADRDDTAGAAAHRDDTARAAALPSAAVPVSRGTAAVLTASDIAALPPAVGTGPANPLAVASDLAIRARGDRSTSFPRPPRTRVIVVANQKGGVGKTTSAVNLAAALALYGARVLLIDLDPQGNASTALGVDHQIGVPSMYEVLVAGLPLADVLMPARGVDQLWCAPATIDLSGAEVELVTAVARENRLRRALSEHLAEPRLQGPARYDYVFVDCPPSLGLMTVNALTAASEVLIPIQCEYYALEGFSQLLNVVDLVRSQLNPGLTVSTVLLTMYDPRTRLAAQVAAEVRAHFGGTVLSTLIPRSVRVSEAPSYSQPVMTYDPTSAGALCYLEAARELATRSHLAGRSPTTARGDAAPPGPHRTIEPAAEQTDLEEIA